MLKFFIFAIVIAVMCLLTKHLVRKKLGLEWEPHLPVNKTHLIVSILFVLVCFALFLTASIKFEWYYHQYLNYYFLILLSLPLQLFRIFMEWKYEKPSKRYLLSFVDLFFFTILIVGLLIFLPL